MIWINMSTREICDETMLPVASPMSELTGEELWREMGLVPLTPEIQAILDAEEAKRQQELADQLAAEEEARRIAEETRLAEEELARLEAVKQAEIAARLATVTEWIKLDTKERRSASKMPTRLPENNPNIFTCDPREWAEYNWRGIFSIDSASEGCTATDYSIEDIDGFTCTLHLVSETNDAEEAVKREQERIAAEIARQFNKPLDLKIAENMFISFCDQLTGKTHQKVGQDILGYILKTQIPDKLTAIEAALTLADINARCQREGGNRWWDDVVWHEELVI